MNSAQVLVVVCLVPFLFIYVFFAEWFSAIFHEIYHCRTANKYVKCDSVILLRTLLIRGKHSWKQKDGSKIIFRLIPFTEWDKFEMKKCLGRAYYSTEYEPYNNQMLIAITRAGLYGSMVGYVPPAIILGAIITAFFKVFFYLPLVLAFLFGMLTSVLFWFSITARKVFSYFFVETKSSRWTDGHIEKDVAGFREYLESLPPNNLHTYTGISMMI